MAISAYKELSNVTVGATELSIVSGTTTLQADGTDGVYQLWVDDQANMTKTEEYKIRVYEKVLSGSTKLVVFAATIKGVQSELFVTPMLILMQGWDMTLQKIAGTDRAFNASIRQIA